MKLIKYSKEKNSKVTVKKRTLKGKEVYIYIISSKLKKLRTKLIITILKSQLLNSASEDENKGTEESKSSDDEYLSISTKLQPYIYKTCFKRVYEIKWSREKIIRFRRRH